MQILLLADGMYPFILGGMQKHSYSMAKYLSLAGIKIHVIQFVHQESEANPLSRKEFDDFNLENFKLTTLPFPEKKKIPGHYLRSNLEFSNHAWNTVKNEIAEYDFIYAQGFTGNRFIIEKKKKIHAVPIAVNFHGFEMFQKAPDAKTKLQHFLFRKKVKEICSGADKVISYGGKITTLIEKLGIPKDKLLESPMGLDDSWFKNLKSEFKINPIRQFIFIGRFERRKGVEELNAALKMLVRSHNGKFNFHFIGPIPDKNKLSEKSIIYHGTINEQEKIREISNNSDILVCPSHSEGMPTVILEGMASGNAIIATDVGAVQLMIDENGWLLPSPNVNLLYKALVKAIDIAERDLLEMKKKSFLKAEKNFKWSLVAKHLIEKLKMIN